MGKTLAISGLVGLFVRTDWTLCARARAWVTLGNFEFSDFLIFKIFRFSDFQILENFYKIFYKVPHARARARAKCPIRLDKLQILENLYKSQIFRGSDS